MLKGFVFNIRNIARLLTLIRSERGRRTCNYATLARCYTRDVLYWEIEECGTRDRLRVTSRTDLIQALRQSDRACQIMQLSVLDMTWEGDEVRSHWRALVRNPGTGAPFFKQGFSRARFRGHRIAEMMTILEPAEEPMLAPARIER